MERNCGENMSDKLKNKFYRTLDLDEDSKKVLKWFRQNIKQIIDNADKRIEIKKDEEE
jgi:hypothetical protein